MIKLLVPDMPTADELLPFLRTLDETKTYVNGGPLVRKLEETLGVVNRCPSTVVANATQGLELVLRALELPRASRVLVPAVTYVASAQAIHNAGLQPVISDVDAGTWKLHASMAHHAAGRLRIDAVMPVAAFGSPVDLHEWMVFNQDTNIPVVIDAAGALTEQECHTINDVHVVFSMHATKFWGAGEGGVVASGNQQMIEKVRDMACFGSGGTNAKMSEYHAAVAMASLARLQEKHLRTMKVYDDYLDALPDELGMQAGPDRGNYTMMNVLLPSSRIAKKAIDFMRLHGIECKQWYAPFISEREEFENSALMGSMEVTEMLKDRLLGLPFHTSLTTADVQIVCIALKEFLA